MIRRTLVAACCCLLASPVWAQSRDNSSLLNQLQRRFESSSPAVGESLPDVSLFDADGQPIHLKNLKGNYTVLVFGCLT